MHSNIKIKYCKLVLNAIKQAKRLYCLNKIIHNSLIYNFNYGIQMVGPLAQFVGFYLFALYRIALILTTS